MAKARYSFNPDTLSFEALPTSSLKTKFLRVLLFFVVSLALSFLYEFIYSKFFDTPKTIRLKKQYSELILQYEFLQKKINQSSKELSEVGLRDNNMYRAVLGLPEMTFPLRETDFSSTDWYKQVINEDVANIVVGTSYQLDRLIKRTYLQSKSLDDVAVLTINMEEMAECVPAIQPVDLKKIRKIGNYGWRSDPVHGDRRHHDGLDFSGNVGLPIYVTGNGRVTRAERAGNYGNLVEIDHGFGYTTRYAHLSAILVKPGQRVKRGEKIALMGNTGKSTGPHLHYEVRYMGRPLDPRNFFSNDLSGTEYNKMLQITSHDGVRD
ncbi:MAG: M23 family metallopeptidase [Prevotellaceae bacterium]|jgi:murein DD-endopeptidase MepM/ murein hydrolase activator NlpD|nr:M23 family metallopeptidase [Prevotellaceae bacterium]